MEKNQNNSERCIDGLKSLTRGPGKETDEQKEEHKWTGLKNQRKANVQKRMYEAYWING